MLYYAKGTAGKVLDSAQVRDGLREAFGKLGTREKVLALPPDHTRYHSRAGELTRYAWEYYGGRLTDVLPALGTHFPMTEARIKGMFGEMPAGLFRVHDWRNDIVTLGKVPAAFVRQVSEGKVDYAWPAQVNKLLVEGGHDLILSIGQVVPHEVVGMANYNKNIFVGAGGQEGINRSHFLGAAYGMERMMGRVDTPVRRVLNYASDHFAAHLPIVYVLTVVGKDGAGGLGVQGLFVGDDIECFELAARLSLRVNFEMVDKPLSKVVVYLDPSEFQSTWLGNKSIYRTRMALADAGELVVLAPGLREFGEDRRIDTLIRKYGYRGTTATLEAVETGDDLRANLSAAAHLIHGSSEGRFKVTYCPGLLTQDEIERAGFEYGDLTAMQQRYDPARMVDGHNVMPDGEEVFFISNPALGLWACRERLGDCME